MYTLCCFAEKLVLLWFTLFCRKICFVAIYALLRGEKLNWRFHMWRKYDKIRYGNILVRIVSYWWHVHQVPSGRGHLTLERGPGHFKFKFLIKEYKFKFNLNCQVSSGRRHLTVERGSRNCIKVCPATHLQGGGRPIWLVPPLQGDFLI